MDKFKLETSIQFPFFKMNELVTYSEVKKPSGVAYILLVLISESKNKNDRLSKVLENFGIPKSLHYIFADNVQYLMEQGILEEFNFYKTEFDNYLIGSFQFTSKGKKIFAEESIPTGINKELKVPVFYNIAMNELLLKMDNDLDPKPLMDCAITPEFMDRFKNEKNVENFLNLQKGKGISVKKEEIITNVEQLDQENWIGKYDCDMNINGDNIEIKFDELLLQKFFDANYNQDMVNLAISYKNKFKFKSSFKDNLKLSNYGFDRIAGIIIPKEIDDVLKQKNQLLLTKGNYKTSNGYMITSSESIAKYDDTIEFIQVDMHDSVYAYIPGNFNFNNNLFGIITIPLALKIKLTEEELKNVIKPYVVSLSTYSEDNFKELVKVTNITDDLKLAKEIIEGYVNKDAESNIVLLNEMKPYAISNSGISNIYRELLEKNYSNYMDNLTEDNLDTALKITASIPKFLNIPNKDVLSRIFKNIKAKNELETYETLVSKGFDKSLVVLYVNPVIEALKIRNSEEKSVIDLINYDDALSEMKRITSINDYKSYLYDEEKINHNDFKTNYNKAFNLQKNIAVFRSGNEGLFANYDGFMNLFSTINDDINLVEAALKNPNNLKPELIEKKIASGEYQFVFVNLSAKLETILKNKYKLDGKLSDMLNDARSNGIIDKKIISDLHDFRDNRNAYVHPEDRTSNYNADDLRRWAKEIFDLEVEGK
ncbi:MAG: hypothetical protein SPF07_00390 [Eubacteriales bacterium]|nr:hypothetical protein [Eubacteriales bacterium]